MGDRCRLISDEEKNVRKKLKCGTIIVWKRKTLQNSCKISTTKYWWLFLSRKLEIVSEFRMIILDKIRIELIQKCNSDRKWKSPFSTWCSHFEQSFYKKMFANFSFSLAFIIKFKPVDCNSIETMHI